jgi:beta-lactamase class A
MTAAVLAVIVTVGIAFLVHDAFGGSSTAAADKGSPATSPAPSTARSSSAAAASSSALAVVSAGAAHSERAVHDQVGANTATAQLTTLAAGQPSGAVSIAATNLSTGVSYTWGATSGMVTASVIKVDTLATLLLQHQLAGKALSDWEDAEAVAMIQHSDNDAADDLWSDVGSDPAVTLANRTFGLTSTVVGDDDLWGLTTTSAADQVILLKQLLTPSALDTKSQAYALGLMRGVEADQAWGVSAVADANTTTALKNGWLNVSDDDDLWTVNSIGIVTVHGQTVALAIMTQHQPDETTGIELVERLAAATVTAVG